MYTEISAFTKRLTPEEIPAIEKASKFPMSLLMYFSLIGFFGNLNIVVATYRKKSLRSPSNVFIAFTASGDCLHEIGNIVSGYLVFTSNWILPYETCFNIQFIFTFGTMISAVMLFMTSLDRMICVVFPHQYNNWDKSAIITFGVVISFLIGAFFTITGHFMVEEGYRFCKILIELPYSLLQVFILICFMFTCLTITSYIVIWSFLRRRNYRNSKQMLRSITAVSMCICSGWLVTMLAGSYFLVIKLAEDYNTALFSALPIEISIALNYPLLYQMSREYRASFREQLHSITYRLLFVDTKTESEVIAVS